jgi:hypothetical protein
MGMIRLLETAVFVLLVLCVAGCNEPERELAATEGLKIGDLAPWRPEGREGIKPLEAANFNIYVFELPAEELPALDEAWLILRAERLRFSNAEAFQANSFMAGSGAEPVLNQLVDLLLSAGARRVQTVALLLPDGLGNNVWVGPVPGERTVFYSTAQGPPEGVTLGPGAMVLRLTAQRYPGLRGLCDLKVQPAFVSPVSSAIPQVAERARKNAFYFELVGFSLKMSPGEFVLLGPAEYIGDGITLASYFFSRPAPDARVKVLPKPREDGSGEAKPYYGPVVRIYLIVCTGVSD